MNDSSRVSGDLKAAPPFHGPQTKNSKMFLFSFLTAKTALPSNALGSAAATETMRPTAPPSGRPVAVGADSAQPAGWSVFGPAHRPGTRPGEPPDGPGRLSFHRRLFFVSSRLEESAQQLEGIRPFYPLLLLATFAQWPPLSAWQFKFNSISIERNRLSPEDGKSWNSCEFIFTKIRCRRPLMDGTD